MIRNNIVTALRSIFRQKGFAFINIAGLSIGIVCFLFIGLYVLDEFSYDRYHEKSERIYRVVPDLHTSSGVRELAQSGPPVAPGLRDEFPEISHSVRFLRGNGLFLIGEKRFQENQVLYADEDVFEVFTFPLIQGDPATALAAPNSVVISRDMAVKYFGSENPMAQVITRNDGTAFIVRGVMENLPANSHFRFDMLLSMHYLEQEAADLMSSWDAFIFPSYILLAENSTVEALEAKLPDFLARHHGPDYGVSLHLQPVTDIYLHSQRRGENGVRGSYSSLLIFISIALAILILACVNYVNLFTARAVDRAREVSIRKVIGAYRYQLVRQFLIESLMISVFAFLLAGLLYLLIQPLFVQLAGKTVSLAMASATPLLYLLPALVLLIAIFAGGYPAFHLSGFLSLDALKGGFSASSKGTRLRKGLVIFQFSITLMLLIGTLIVNKQLDHFRGQHLGFDSEEMLVINFRGNPAVVENYPVIRQALLAHPAVSAISASDRTPGGGVTSTGIAMVQDGDTLGGIFGRYAVDENFIDNYNIHLAAGRAFSPDFSTDDNEAVIINEAAVAYFGWSSPQESLGKTLIGIHDNESRVIGVVKDFNFNSLHSRIEPLYMIYAPERYRSLSLRLETTNLNRTITDLQAIWDRQVQAQPFNYFFLNQQLEKQYRAEERFSDVVAVFTALAIIIACLGILGLAAFEARQRTREIGIRKVLGASFAQLLALLSKDFIKLVLYANIIAWPLIYWFSGQWLQSFAYRADISIGIYLLAAAATLLLAIATISYLTFRAAMENPVKALRNE